jgi:hypothetical protein
MQKRIRNFRTLLYLILGTALLLTALNCFCQVQGDALPVHVSFSFQTNLAAPRFINVSEHDIELQAASDLAAVCSATLRPWGCDNGAGIPSLRIWTSVRNDGTWFLEMQLEHTPGRPDVQDHWQASLLRAEDIRARGGLPVDRNWIPLLTATFRQLIAGPTTSGRELFRALEEFAPLGKGVAVLSPAAFPLPSAALPLRWDKYKELSGCRFRIFYRDQNGVLVSIHSDGAGRPIDFTPDAPLYKGLLVVHKKWQMGLSDDDLEPIRDHLNDLSGLTPIEFYVEEMHTVPAGVAIAK